MHVDTYFADRRLADVCTSEQKMITQFGSVRARRLGARLQQLRVAESLADLSNVTAGCQELDGDQAGQLALGLDGQGRLLFAPRSHSVDDTGRMRWDTVDAVVIVAVVN
ncbi:killer suppression protein [Mycobacteroides abscessus subsp. abscessus]|nr:killer suppression protein [Mycobacteroides abscessus subsp. abscessus]